MLIVLAQLIIVVFVI